MRQRENYSDARCYSRTEQDINDYYNKEAEWKAIHKRVVDRENKLTGLVDEVRDIKAEAEDYNDSQAMQDLVQDLSTWLSMVGNSSGLGKATISGLRDVANYYKKTDASGLAEKLLDICRKMIESKNRKVLDRASLEERNAYRRGYLRGLKEGTGDDCQFYVEYEVDGKPDTSYEIAFDKDHAATLVKRDHPGAVIKHVTYLGVVNY